MNQRRRSIRFIIGGALTTMVLLSCLGGCGGAPSEEAAKQPSAGLSGESAVSPIAGGAATQAVPMPARDDPERLPSSGASSPDGAGAANTGGPDKTRPPGAAPSTVTDASSAVADAPSGSAESANAAPDTSPPQAASRESGKAGLSYDCGDISFGAGKGQTKLPLYCLRARRAVEDPGSSQPIIAIKQPFSIASYTVPDELRGQLDAYWLNLGDNVNQVLLLAPRGWKAESADMGADGSIGIRLTNPTDPRQYVDYRDAGGCSGCALVNAASYFPELAKTAEDQGFFPEEPDFSGRTGLSSHLMAYGLEDEQKSLETNGVVYQNVQDPKDIPFKQEEVRLGRTYHDLATAILNLFVRMNS